MKSLPSVVFGIFASLWASSSFADATWSLTPSTTPAACLGNVTVTTYCNAQTYGNGGGSFVAPTTTGAGSSYVLTNISAISTLVSSTAIGIDTVSWYGSSGTNVGWGAGSSTVASGAIDNTTALEMILLTFSGPVRLTTVNIGFNGTDSGGGAAASDISVLAYQPTGIQPKTLSATSGTTLLGKDPGTLTSSGWTAIGSYVNVGGSNGVSPSAPGGSANISGQTVGVYSSYWLIGAYTPIVASVYCATGASGCSISGTTNDSFNLVSVSGVPEPGSLALLAAAALGLMSTSRRRVRVAAS